MATKKQQIDTNLSGEASKNESEVQAHCVTNDATSSQAEQNGACKVSTYRQPPLELLNKSAVAEDTEADRRAEVAEKITNKLAVFNIRVKISDTIVGPTVTSYVFDVLSQRTRVGEINRFADDLRECVESRDDVRIVAPWRGKNQVCIEVTNKTRRRVLLRDVLESEKFQKNQGDLVFAIGQGTDGEALVADLVDMPHLLIAGIVGSGKTMALNCLIVSLLYKYGPEYVRFVLVDPKLVELSRYNGLPHMLTDEAVICNSDALASMDYLICEMESRYQLFRQNGVDCITQYNRKVASNATRMPYLVFVVDELYDLMCLHKRAFETKLHRITQTARAAGIHIVLATQRLDAKNITGTIKANLPSRMAFKTISYMDSGNIVGRGGAEKLSGRGDMLFLPPLSMDLVRVQGAYISNEEIKAVVDNVRNNNQAQFDENVAKSIFVSKKQAEECDVDEQQKKRVKFKLTANGKSYRVCSCNGMAPSAVVIPDTYRNLPVTKIGEGAFRNCDEPVSVVISNGVTSIGEEAFANCGNLAEVNIANSVKTIQDMAFWGCTSLKDVYYCGTQEQWQAVQIGAGNEDLTNATIHFVQ